MIYDIHIIWLAQVNKCSQIMYRIDILLIKTSEDLYIVPQINQHIKYIYLFPFQTAGGV